MAELSKWQVELKNSIRKPADLLARGMIRESELAAIEKIHEYFPFSITPYYAGLINWDNPNDPLLRIVAPSIDEQDRSGSLDVSGEAENTQNTGEEGTQMKYPSTVLMLPIPVCFAYCRFCFRKRLFNPEVKGEEILKNLGDALSFIKDHPSVNNILLTGGDPLMIKTSMLRKFLREIRKVPHVKIIRFGTRVLTFLPSRITSDPELLDLLKEINEHDKRVYFVNHFNHPNELTEEVGKASDSLIKSGVILANQSVFLRGVNDSPEILRDLFNKLAAWGITPYYIFQCKFIKGSGHFRIPLIESCDLFDDATRGLNGLAKRVKFIMAHFSGKIEVLGTEMRSGERWIFLKYHQARNEALIGKVLSFPLPEQAYWFDDLPGVNTDPRLQRS